MIRKPAKAGRRNFRPRKDETLHHRGTALFSEVELPGFFDTFEQRDNAPPLELLHHRLEQRKTRPRLHQVGNPVRVEFYNFGAQLIDALDAGLFRAVIINRNGKAMVAQRAHK